MLLGHFNKQNGAAQKMQRNQRAKLNKNDLNN